MPEFTAKAWKEGAGGGTPLTAAALIDLETRLATYAASQPGPTGPAGTNGTNGTNGAAGATGAAGPAGLNWRGAWAAGTEYAKNDAVTWSGSSYRSKTEVLQSGHEPPNGTYWEVLAEKGAEGPKGATGGEASVAAEKEAREAALKGEKERAEGAETAKLAKTSNLSDLGNAATARGNLGLGTAATQATGAFDAAGAAAAAQATEEARAKAAEKLLVPVAAQRGGLPTLDCVTFGTPVRAGTPLTPVAERAYYMRFYPFEERAYTKLAFCCAVAGEASNKVDVGLYSVNAENKLVRIWHSGEAEGRLTATGLKEVAMAEWKPSPFTVYYVGFVAKTILAAAKISALQYENATLIGRAGTSAPNALVLYQNAVAGELPATAAPNGYGPAEAPFMWLVP